MTDPRTAPHPRTDTVNERRELQQLRGFAADVMRESNNDGYYGDVDGGALQEIAKTHGLLIETRADAPCGEPCPCAEMGDFPLTCYRHSPLLKSLLFPTGPGGTP